MPPILRNHFRMEHGRLLGMLTDETNGKHNQQDGEDTGSDARID